MSNHYFNSQPHEEADAIVAARRMVQKEFQLTASRRGWQDSFSGLVKQGNFNSQPHEEADEMIMYSVTLICISTHSLTKRLTVFFNRYFELTASRRGWPAQPKRHRLGKHFNSQPHEEADLQAYACTDGLKQISTHSLTKRLTMSDSSIDPI